jgi:calcineurin-like phosphoesterase family protein
MGRPAGKIRLRVRVGVVLLFLGLSLAAVDATVSSEKAPERVVAVGDVHGDFDNFCLILRRSGLVDENNHWTGGSATLVQTGDLIDRGPKGRDAMDLVMELEKEAAKKGGAVVPLLGNHEVMNILGDLRYVTPQSYAAFADSESEKRRKAAYEDYAAWAASHAKWLAAIKKPALPTTEEEWMAGHPAGFVEYREAFSATGKYGRWVRQHAAVAKIGDVIFLHGGIPVSLISSPLEEVNSKVHEEIENFDKTVQELVARKVVLPFFTMREIAVAVQGELLDESAAETAPDAGFHNELVRLLDFNNWLCMRDEGPLWFRGYDTWSEEEGESQIPKILAAYHAGHVVVAHTVQQPTRIRSRFGGKVFLIDTGMLATYWPGGRASALDIRGGKYTAQYLDGQEVLLEEKLPASAGKAN